MSTISAGTTLGTALVLSGDTNGNLVVKTGASATTAATFDSGGTVTLSSVTAFTSGTASAPAITTTGDTDTGIYFPTANETAVTTGGTVAAAFNSNGLFFRNRIINGDMRIDQRNAGASVTPTASTYTLDRWRFGCSQASKVSVQQSTTAPSGFTNSTILTVGAAANVTVASGDEFWYQQRIEGFNVADLAFGTASALTFTVSFWVRSSVTGTYAASFQNNATNYSYVSTFTINSANTFEYKTLTIPGPTAGTWTTDNTVGLYLAIDLGSGSSMNTTAGSWQSGYYRRTSGCVSWVTNNSATFYITGVQLETGSVATPFERRPYGTELMLCQRYYFRTTSDDTAYMFGGAYADSATRGFAYGSFPVTMRVAPSAIEQNGTAANYYIRSGGTDRACSGVPVFNSATTQYAWQVETTVASGQTAGQAGYFYAGVSGAYLGWSAEL